MLSNKVLLSALRAAAWFITTTSSPASSAWCCRNDSRTTRLILFLPVAGRQFFFEIARPSLAASVSLPRQSTVNQRSRLRVAFLNTREYAAASRSRCSFWSRNRELPANAGGFGGVTGRASRGLWRGGASTQDGRPLSPYGLESRGCGRALFCSADTYVSLTWYLVFLQASQ